MAHIAVYSLPHQKVDTHRGHLRKPVKDGWKPLAPRGSIHGLPRRERILADYGGIMGDIEYPTK